MDDLISRQAAIDALDCINGTEEVLRSLQSAQPTDASCWGCNCQKMERLREQKTFSEMVHLHGPEMHDKRTETHGVCLDTISRQAAIDAIVAWTVEDRPDIEMPTDLVGRINALPSAQPEIVRCKDCKHYENDVMGNQWGVCCHPDWITDNCGNLVDESGWCYRAERRTNENNSNLD